MVETKFRKELGEVNPYMCIVDSAVKEIINVSTDNTNKKEYLSKITKKAGHPKIYTDHIKFDSLIQLVQLSHISFIQSKAEECCSNINLLKNINNAHKKDIDGDFLRKTIYIIEKSKEGKKPKKEGKPKKLGKEIYLKYIDEIEILIIDYYRLVRNTTFHSNSDSICLDKHFGENIELIESKFGFKPNSQHNLNENDVYLFSVAWQSCIKKLCSLLTNIERDVIPLLHKRFKSYKNKERIRNGTILTLKQEYLIKDEVILDKISESISTSIIG